MCGNVPNHNILQPLNMYASYALLRSNTGTAVCNTQVDALEWRVVLITCCCLSGSLDFQTASCKKFASDSKSRMCFVPIKTTYKDCPSSPSMYLHKGANASQYSTISGGCNFKSVSAHTQQRQKHWVQHFLMLKLCTYEEQSYWHSGCAAGSQVQVEVVL